MTPTSAVAPPPGAGQANPRALRQRYDDLPVREPLPGLGTAALLLGSLQNKRPGETDTRRRLFPRRVAPTEIVYVCLECDLRYLGERRCPDCTLFTQVWAPGRRARTAMDGLPSPTSAPPPNPRSAPKQSKKGIDIPRSIVVGIFPNRLGIIRLVGALLPEQYDDGPIRLPRYEFES